MKTSSSPHAPSRRRIWSGLAFILVFALTGALALDIYRTATAKDLVPWRTDIEQAVQDAEAQGRPVLLYFTAAWCGPCRDMRRDVYSVEAVAQQIAAAAVPVKVDLTTQDPATLEYDVAMQLQVYGFPTLVLLEPGEGERGRLTGYIPADDLLAWLADKA